MKVWVQLVIKSFFLLGSLSSFFFFLPFFSFFFFLSFFIFGVKENLSKYIFFSFLKRITLLKDMKVDSFQGKKTISLDLSPNTRIHFEYHFFLLTPINQNKIK